jgi:hypothetical protein
LPGDEYRSALGHVVLRYVGAEGYLAVANAYEALQTLTDRVRGESREADLTAEQRWAAGRTFLTLCRAISYLGLLIDLPPVWNPVALPEHQSISPSGPAMKPSSDTPIE